MIDNFDLIKPLFYFNEANDMFMHCQIVCRAKDHPGEKVKEGPRKTYFIRSREQLESLKEEIIMLCNLYGARAYINPAGKDFSKVQTLLLMKIASDVHQGNVRNPRKCLNSAAGECKSRASRWIVDIDDMSLLEPIKNWMLSTIPFETTIWATIPTKAGCHLITEPFNTSEFSKAFPEVDVHKNSMGTLLYMPDIKK